MAEVVQQLLQLPTACHSPDVRPLGYGPQVLQQPGHAHGPVRPVPVPADARWRELVCHCVLCRLSRNRVRVRVTEGGRGGEESSEGDW